MRSCSFLPRDLRYTAVRTLSVRTTCALFPLNILSEFSYKFGVEFFSKMSSKERELAVNLFNDSQTSLKGTKQFLLRSLAIFLLTDFNEI